MEEKIAEHRVNATVDDCYMLAEQIAGAEDILVEFTGRLDEDSGGFSSMTCDIQVQYPQGIVQVGSLDFVELTQDTTMFQVYERLPDGAPEAGGGATDGTADSTVPGERNLIHAMMELVLSGLRERGFLD